MHIDTAKLNAGNTPYARLLKSAQERAQSRVRLAVLLGSARKRTAFESALRAVGA
ncbi:MAG: hypothetical protein KF696_09900 [Planctomycetes bacterium]|nr:hypothetical protein [Planctomycetota bacterium]MCW8136170.1 hypothetical protein [Planctomycetota bacterium]